MEVAAKILFKRADPKKLSANEPDFYQHRFMTFMRNGVFDKSPDMDASNPIVAMIN